MSHDKHIQPIGDHIQRQHHELQERVRAIGHLLLHHPDERTLDCSLVQVHQLLKELRNKLAEHFAQEEDGGYMEEAVGRMPRLGACVAMLEKQHPQLLTAIDRIIASAESKPAALSQWQHIGKEFAGFARTLLQHEDTENRILQEGFNDDLGLECEDPLANDGMK